MCNRMLLPFPVAVLCQYPYPFTVKYGKKCQFGTWNGFVLKNRSRCMGPISYTTYIWLIYVIGHLQGNCQVDEVFIIREFINKTRNIACLRRVVQNKSLSFHTSSELKIGLLTSNRSTHCCRPCAARLVKSRLLSCALSVGSYLITYCLLLRI